MKLLSDWKAILKRAWSVKLMALAVILSGAEVALPFMYDLLPIPTGIFAALSGLTTCGALIARHVAQKELSGE